MTEEKAPYTAKKTRAARTPRPLDVTFKVTCATQEQADQIRVLRDKLAATCTLQEMSIADAFVSMIASFINDGK